MIDQTYELLKVGIYSASIVFVSMLVLQGLVHVVEQLFFGGDE